MIEQARRSGPDAPDPRGLHFNRARAFELLGDLDRAADEMQEATRELGSGPDDADYVVNVAELLWRVGRRPRAMEVLGSFLDRRPVARVAAHYAHLAGADGVEPHRERAVRLAEDLLSGGAPSDDETTGFLLHSGVNLCRRIDDRERGERLITHVPDLPPYMLETVRGVHQHRWNDPAAGDTAERARTALDTVNDPSDLMVRNLAELLFRLGRDPEAFELFERVVPRNQATPDAAPMVQSGLNADYGPRVLKFCRDLRAAGVCDRACREAEVQLLIQLGCLEKAAGLAGETAAETVEKDLGKRMRFLRSVCGVLGERPEWVESDPQRLPAFDAVRGRDVKVLAEIYCSDGGPGAAAALDKLYPLARAVPADRHARRAFAGLFVPRDRIPTLTAPGAVAPGTAVGLSEPNASPEHAKSVLWWAVAAPDDPPATEELNEVAPDHPTAERLLGKRVGDVVLLEEQGRTVARRVCEVVTKYMYLCRHICGTWETLFPDESFIRVVSMKDPRGKYDFDPMIRRMEEGRRGEAALLDIYESGPVPLAMLAERLGMNGFDVHRLLAAERDRHINCADGTVEQRTAALAALDRADGVVIGPVAAGTVLLHRLHERITRWPIQITVAAATVRQFRAAVHEDMRGAGRGWQAYVVDGRVVMREWSEQELRAYRTSLETFCDWLETECEVEDGEASLDLAERHRWLEFTDDATTHSVGLARRSGIPLWNDDLAVRVLASQWEQVKTACTFEFFRELVARQAIDEVTSRTMEAELIGHGYRYALVTEHVVGAAGTNTHWDSREFPLRGVLAAIGGAAFNTYGVWLGAVRALHAIAAAPLVDRRERCVAAVTEAVAGHADGRTVLRLLAQPGADLFGVQVLFADAVRTAAARRLDRDRPDEFIFPH